MREYFKKEVLDRTYEIFGVNQTDEEKMSEDDVKFLLDGLCQVSKNYSYIPEAEQKKIISACMLSDKTYRNINLRLVAGWLEQNGKKYFTEVAHKESKQPENYKPLEGAERDAMLTLWQNALQHMNENFTEATKVKGGGTRLREQFAPLPTTPPKNENNYPVKSFWIDGFEIYAKDETDAMRIFVENFGQPISNEITTEEKRTEGVGEGTTTPENNSDTPQPDENIQDETLTPTN